MLRAWKAPSRATGCMALRASTNPAGLRGPHPVAARLPLPRPPAACAALGHGEGPLPTLTLRESSLELSFLCSPTGGVAEALQRNPRAVLVVALAEERALLAQMASRLQAGTILTAGLVLTFTQHDTCIAKLGLLQAVAVLATASRLNVSDMVVPGSAGFVRLRLRSRLGRITVRCSDLRRDGAAFGYVAAIRRSAGSGLQPGPPTTPPAPGPDPPPMATTQAHRPREQGTAPSSEGNFPQPHGDETHDGPIAPEPPLLDKPTIRVQPDGAISSSCGGCGSSSNTSSAPDSSGSGSSRQDDGRSCLRQTQLEASEGGFIAEALQEDEAADVWSALTVRQCDGPPGAPAVLECCWSSGPLHPHQEATESGGEAAGTGKRGKPPVEAGVEGTADSGTGRAQPPVPAPFSGQGQGQGRGQGPGPAGGPPAGVWTALRCEQLPQLVAHRVRLEALRRAMERMGAADAAAPGLLDHISRCGGCRRWAQARLVSVRALLAAAALAAIALLLAVFKASPWGGAGNGASGRTLLAAVAAG